MIRSLLFILVSSLLSTSQTFAIGLGSQSEYERRIDARARKVEREQSAREAVIRRAYQLRVAAALDQELKLPAGSVRPSGGYNEFSARGGEILCAQERTFRGVHCVNRDGEMLGGLNSVELEQIYNQR